MATEVPVGGDRSLADQASRTAARMWLPTVYLAVTLVAILSLAYPLGYLGNNANAARAVAIFAIGVVSFLGMLTIARQGSESRSFGSYEVRVAVTTAFVMVYFAVLGIFLFSTNTVGTFGQNLVDNLTSLFGVVVGFYFAASAVVEYGRTRGLKEGDQADRAERHSSPPAAPIQAAESLSSLEEQVRALRGVVAMLVEAQTARPAGSNAATRPTETIEGSPEATG